MTGTRVILWGAAAVVAVAVTTAVVAAAASTGGRDAGVLSQDEVAGELAGAASGEPTPSGPSVASDPSPDVAVNPEVLSSRAGTLVVTCSAGTALLQRWSPNAGYRADDVIRGPAAAVSVWFESDRQDDVKVIVRCDGGRAVLTEEVEFDDHGGGKSGRG